MQHDEVIWQVINQGFCSYKVKTQTQNFCKNRFNLTGLCNRTSCPLANSRYATVIEEKGICYLHVKTIERAHSPRDMWERIMLDRNYTRALAQIDAHLAYWPSYMIHRTKQRLTKIHQYLIRMRKLKLKVQTKLVSVTKKVERRETRREVKAEKAARLSDAITQELVARLQAGTYDGSGMYLPEKAYNRVLDVAGEADAVDEDAIDEEADMDGEEEGEEEVEGEEEGEFELEEEEEEEEEEEDGGIEYVADFGEDEDDLEDIAAAYALEDEDLKAHSARGTSKRSGSTASTDDSDDDIPTKKRKGGKPTKGGKRTGKIELEYEREEERESAR